MTEQRHQMPQAVTHRGNRHAPETGHTPSQAIRAGTFPARFLTPAEVQSLGFADDRFEAVGLDDTFRFGCRVCGFCCVDRASCSNILSGYDVAQLAEGLGVTTTVILEQLAQFAPIQNAGGWFGFQLRAAKRCPFLLPNGECGIHAFKPTVCRAAPLGVVFFPEQRGFALLKEKTRGQWCPGMDDGREYSVAEWLDLVPAAGLVALAQEHRLLLDIADLYHARYPQPNPDQVLVAGGCGDMIESLIFDVSRLPETLTLTVDQFNALLHMSPLERYHVGWDVARGTVEELRRLHAAGETFPEHFRPNGYER